MREEGGNILWETKSKTYNLLQGYDVHDDRLALDEATLDKGTWYKTKTLSRKLDQETHLPYDDGRIEGYHYTPAKDHPKDNPDAFLFYGIGGIFDPSLEALGQRSAQKICLFSGFNKRPIWTKIVGEVESETGLSFVNPAPIVNVLGDNTLVLSRFTQGETDSDNPFTGYAVFITPAGVVTSYTASQISTLLGGGITYSRGYTITHNALWLLLERNGYRLIKITPSGLSTSLVSFSGAVNIRASIFGLRNRLNFIYSKPEGGGSFGGGDHEGIFVRQYSENSQPVGVEIQIRPANISEIVTFGSQFSPRILSEGSALIPASTGRGGSPNLYRFKYNGSVLTDLVQYPEGEPFTNYGSLSTDGTFMPDGTVIDIDQYGYKFVIDSTRQVRINKITKTNGDDYFWDVPRVAVKDLQNNLKYRLRIPTRSNGAIGISYPWYRITEKILVVLELVRVSPPVVNGLPVSVPNEINIFNRLPAYTFSFYDLRMAHKYATIIFPRTAVNADPFNQIKAVYTKDPHFYDLLPQN